MHKRLLAGCVFLVALSAAPSAQATPVCTDGFMNGPPRALCGNRIFPEAEMARAYIQFAPQPGTGFAEYRHGLEYIAASYPRWVSVTTLAELYDDEDAKSAGPDEIRSYLANDSGDGRDIPVLKMTDHQVPDDEKQALFFSLSVHGNERGGLEGGVRTAEDLAIAALHDGGELPDGADNADLVDTCDASELRLSTGVEPSAEHSYGSAEEGGRLHHRLQRRRLGDGRHLGRARRSLYNRGNQIGTDLNRQMPTIGRINLDAQPAPGERDALRHAADARRRRRTSRAT